MLSGHICFNFKKIQYTTEYCALKYNHLHSYWSVCILVCIEHLVKKAMKEMMECSVKHKKKDEVNFSDCCGDTPDVRGLILKLSL